MGALLALVTGLAADPCAGLLQMDQHLRIFLEGSNQRPGLDCALETFALATPLIELGTGFYQSNNGNHHLARTILHSYAATQMGVIGMKYLFRRSRPDRNYRPRLWNTRLTPSFPSGHSASSAAFAAVMGRLYPHTRPWMTAYTALSAFSQVYVGNHYPLDVLGGWLIGYLTGRILARDLSPSSPEKGNPQVIFKIAIPL